MSLIRNSLQTKQGIDFTGLQNGKIHPTDIDALLEFDNRLLILFEMKRRGNNIPLGQKIALERIVDNWTNNGRVAIAIKLEHNYNEPVDVPIEECEATQYYMVGFNYWFRPRTTNTIELLNTIGEKYGITKLRFNG